MNTIPLARSGVNDALLFDIARRIQLSPTNYRLAQERYQTLDTYLRRPDSILREHIVRLYPQGSMAIGAVISSKFDNDEFDVDIVVELAIDPNTPPANVLGSLHEAIRATRDSRYFGKTKRRSRCITVEYDEMHIDFTPVVRLIDPRERVSHIFHANENETVANHFHVVANPWGFAQWFESRMPAAQLFAEAVLRKHAEPLPEQDELNARALPLLALQLLKRWRNKCYDDRRGIRKPPSVVLSYYVALMARGNRGLLAELTAQADALLNAFEACHRNGSLVQVGNPTCGEDIFTDRWPESSAHQTLFLDDLRQLREQLAELSGAPSLEQSQTILSSLFGERATAIVMKAFAERYSQSAFGGRLQHHPLSGALALRESGIGRFAAAVPGAIPAPRNTTFGSQPRYDKADG